MSIGSTKANFFEVRFSMLDPPSLLRSMMDTLGLGSEVNSEERRHERVKNLDRWWYCDWALFF